MRLSFDRLWVVIALALPALLSLLVPLPAVDLAYQVRAGDEILATGALPAVDTWTYTIAGTPWVDQQWLAQVLLALGYADRRLGAARGCPRRARRVGARPAARRARRARHPGPHRGGPVARRVPALGARARAPAAAVRHRRSLPPCYGSSRSAGGGHGHTCSCPSSWSCGQTCTGASSSRPSSSGTRGWRTSWRDASGADRSSCSSWGQPRRSSTRSASARGPMPRASARIR